MNLIKIEPGILCLGVECRIVHQNLAVLLQDL